MAAQFEIPRPTTTGNKGEGKDASFDIYLDAQGKPLRWSGKISLPELGDRIRITMNNIGPALVVGFFAEDGFLGVMTKALDPPKWLLEQRDRDAKRPDFANKPLWYQRGIGCEFGAEIAAPAPESESNQCAK